MKGHFAVTIEDIQRVAKAVLRHRILLNFQAEASGTTTEDVIDELFASVSRPASPLD